MRLAVRSVLDQDTTGWRLVIVDDCYPDDVTSDWLASLQGPDVVYVRNEKTLGVNGNFRRALSLATAEHVVFMGCDDLLEPGYVAAVRRTLAQHPDAAIVCPGVQVIDDAGHAVGAPGRPRQAIPAAPTPVAPATLAGEDALVSLMSGNWTYFPSLCWRRDVIADIDFRPEYGVVLDLGLLVDVLVAGGELVVIPDRALQVPPPRRERVRDEDGRRRALRGGAALLRARSPPSSTGVACIVPPVQHDGTSPPACTPPRCCRSPPATGTAPP